MESSQLTALHRFESLCQNTIPSDFLRYCLYALSGNDPQHSVERVYHICETGLRVFDHYQPIFHLTPRDRLLTLIGCLMCDIGCQYNPQSHHLTGYGLVYEYQRRHWPGEFNEHEIGVIANAVLSHRTSQRYRPVSVIGELVCVAAVGCPDIETSVRRAVKYSLLMDHQGTTTLNAVVQEVHQFLLDRYGTLGYHWPHYPELGKAYFKDEWAFFTQQLNQSTVMTEKITLYCQMLSKEPWSMMQ